MERWEYRKFEILVEGNEFIARYDNYPIMQGWDTIMEHWTDHGWELVSLVPLKYEKAMFSFSESYHVTHLLAVWKRRKAAQEEP